MHQKCVFYITSQAIALNSSSTVTSEPDSPGEETSELESLDDLKAIATSH
jgi:hypothetical protein